MNDSFIKFYRAWLDNPIILKDTEHLAVWIYIISRTSYKEREALFFGKVVTVSINQALISQSEMARELKIERTKIARIMTRFKSEKLIEYQTDNKKTLITLDSSVLYQGINEQQGAKQVQSNCKADKETENEKEKSSKREKVKEKEIKKNNRIGDVCIHNTQGKPPLRIGIYENVLVDSSWLENFKSRYSYADSVINNLSIYKKAKGIVNKDDTPYLEQFAINDKSKYVDAFSTFDAEDFFNSALKRSYADMEL